MAVKVGTKEARDEYVASIRQPPAVLGSHVPFSLTIDDLKVAADACRRGSNKYPRPSRKELKGAADRLDEAIKWFIGA